MRKQNTKGLGAAIFGGSLLMLTTLVIGVAVVILVLSGLIGLVLL